MVTLSPGSVVVVAFPFSDPSATKFRPAVVLTEAGRDDWILYQQTSRHTEERTVQANLDRDHRRLPEEHAQVGERAKTYLSRFSYRGRTRGTAWREISGVPPVSHGL